MITLNGVSFTKLLRYRKTLIILANTFLTAGSFLLALGFRFDFVVAPKLTLHFTVIPLLILLASRLALYSLFHLNEGYWRYTSVHEAVQIAKAHFLSSLLFGATLFVLQIPGFPRSLPAVEFFLSLVLSGGARVLARLVREKYFAKRAQLVLGPKQSAVIIGAGRTGHLLVRTLRSQERSPYHPVGVFDDDLQRIGQSVHGVPIVGTLASLEGYLKRHPEVSLVVVAIAHLPLPTKQWLEKTVKAKGIELRIVRDLYDILSSSLAKPHEKTSAEELLNRETTVERNPFVAGEITAKRVLVTGAGGSIGSELVRQILSYEPSELVLLDKNEFNLYQIDQEIRENQLAQHTKIVRRLADVADEVRTGAIFRAHAPQLVFHAAAYKHVPMLEDNAHSGFWNNVVGTRLIFELSLECRAERFVLISTDKAVDPVSFMGCTKRLAELLVTSDARSQLPASVRAHAEKMISTVVRFGNVINSAGSVIPLFVKQLERGRPLTVTHPEIERYFMSIREAVRLVLLAGTLGDDRKTYLLDMGEPIKILDVAQKLRVLYDRPDLPIVVTGLRPGEKISEQLYSESERRLSTRFEKMFAVEPKAQISFNINTVVDEVESQVDSLANDDLRHVIRTLANGDELQAKAGLLKQRKINEKLAQLSATTGATEESSSGFAQ